MSIARHPDTSTLMTCSAGSQPEALCAVVTSHISICPTCQRDLVRMEAIGVPLFEELGPEAMTRDAMAIVGSMRRSIGQTAELAGRSRHDVPFPLVEILGPSLDALDWTFLKPGIWTHEVPLRESSRGDLRLLKLDPGSALSEHRHAGEELTVVLRGSYVDQGKLFQAGDFAESDDGVRHRIVADAQAGCIVLMASEQRPEFLL